VRACTPLGNVAFDLHPFDDVARRGFLVDKIFFGDDFYCCAGCAFARRSLSLRFADVAFPAMLPGSRSGKPSSTGLKRRHRAALISMTKQRGPRPHRSARHGVAGGPAASGTANKQESSARRKTARHRGITTSARSGRSLPTTLRHSARSTARHSSSIPVMRRSQGRGPNGSHGTGTGRGNQVRPTRQYRPYAPSATQRIPGTQALP
jgi:hypothetical protein